MADDSPAQHPNSVSALLRVLSTMMDYPGQTLLDYQQDILNIIQDSPLSTELKTQLSDFVAQLCCGELMDHQEEYVALFDRGRSLSLLLFEHVHGESRDRGQAMVNLIELYRSRGLELDKRELPDHIPLYLEFLSSCPPQEAIQWLAEAAHIFALLAVRLEKRQSPYHTLFQCLLHLARAEVDLEALKKDLGEEAEESSLDDIWEEEAVRFIQDPPQSKQQKSDETNPLQWVDASKSKGAS